MYIDWIWIIIGGSAIGFTGMVIGRRLGIDEYHRIIQQQIRIGRLKEIDTEK